MGSVDTIPSALQAGLLCPLIIGTAAIRFGSSDTPQRLGGIKAALAARPLVAFVAIAVLLLSTLAAALAIIFS